MRKRSSKSAPCLLLLAGVVGGLLILLGSCVGSVAFSPDGKMLAFTGIVQSEDYDEADGLPPGKADRLYLMEVASGAVRPLHQARGSLSQPVYHPDGHSVFVLELECEREGTEALLDLVQLGVAGGERRVIARFLLEREADLEAFSTLTDTAELAISPQGKHLAFQLFPDRTDGMVILVDLADRRAEAIALGASRPAFLPEDGGLVFVAAVDEGALALMLPVTDAARPDVVDLAGARLPHGGSSSAIVHLVPTGRGAAAFTIQMLHELPTPPDKIFDLALTSDGKHAAVASEGGVLLLGPGPGESTRLLEAKFRECVFLGADELCLVRSNGTLVAFDLQTRETMSLWNEPDWPLFGLGASPVGQTLAALVIPEDTPTASPLLWIHDRTAGVTRILPTAATSGIEVLDETTSRPAFGSARPATRTILRRTLERLEAMVVAADLPEEERAAARDGIAGIRRLGEDGPVGPK